MANKLMYIPNDDTQITPSVDKNYWLKRFDTQLNKPTNHNPIKSPKLLRQSPNPCPIVHSAGLIAHTKNEAFISCLKKMQILDLPQ